MIGQPELLAAIDLHAASLIVPSDCSAKAILAALTYCETDWGRLVLASRYEKGYDRNGQYYNANRQRVAVYGSAACSSWGAYQMMYPTACEFGYSGHPWGLIDPQVATELAVAYLNKRVRSPDGPRAYADAWNSGTNTDTIIPGAYMEKFATGYAEALAHYDGR